MDRMRALACRLRTPAACSKPAGVTSATKQPRPRSRRGSSLRRIAAPMREVYSPTSTMAMTGPPPCGPWCIASTDTNTAGSPIAAAATPPTAALLCR